MKLYDISEPIAEETAVFPGDTPFSREWIMRMEDGGSCNVSTIRMSAHCGTHTDAPLHFDREGADMVAVDLGAYIGSCRVVDMRGEGEPALVPAAALTSDLLAGVERILFRTRSSHDHSIFDSGFTAVGTAAAHRLVEAGVRLVGIDSPSMDHATATDLQAHRVLCAGGVAILENLDLSQVSPGDYRLSALPLKIIGSDSSPVRAVLWRD